MMSSSTVASNKMKAKPLQMQDAYLDKSIFGANQKNKCLLGLLLGFGRG